MSDSANQNIRVANQPPDERPRRFFLWSALSVMIGAFLTIVPLVPGIGVLLSPLCQKKKKGGERIRITTLEALRGKTLPLRFPVIAARRDAWNQYPPEPIDGVYLLPQGTAADGSINPPLAFSATCPHLGCAVDFADAQKQYRCPCHTSAFDIDGVQLFGPSPRGMDPLTVKIENGEVWIIYQRFEIGKKNRIPV